MKTLIVVVLIAVVCFYLTQSKSQKLWRILAKHPYAVLGLIEKSPDWVITMRGGKVCGAPPKEPGWSGPFNLVVPDEGRLQFYGRSDTYEKDLERLAEFIRTGRLPEVDFGKLFKS